MRAWKVSLFDSEACLWESEIPRHRLSEEGVQTLLQCLVSQYLTPDEISSSLLNRRIGGPSRSHHLDVDRYTDCERKTFMFTYGNNPYAIAHPAVTES